MVISMTVKSFAFVRLLPENDILFLAILGQSRHTQEVDPQGSEVSGFQ
jgi:hypothetical protein